MTPSTNDLIHAGERIRVRQVRVIGEEDDPAEALEDLRRKKKAEHKRELKKKEEKGKVDKKKAEAELNATLANLTLPPKSTEPWDVDPGGLPAPGGGPELVVVHRSQSRVRWGGVPGDQGAGRKDRAELVAQVGRVQGRAMTRP